MRCTAYADVLVLHFYSLLFSGRIFCSVSAFDVRAQRFETAPESMHWMKKKKTNISRALYNSSTHTPYRIDCARLYSISFGRTATKKQHQQQLHSYKTKETIQCILVFRSLCFFFAKTISLGHYNNYRTSGSAIWPSTGSEEENDDDYYFFLFFAVVVFLVEFY